MDKYMFSKKEVETNLRAGQAAFMIGVTADGRTFPYTSIRPSDHIKINEGDAQLVVATDTAHTLVNNTGVVDRRIAERHNIMPILEQIHASLDWRFDRSMLRYVESLSNKDDIAQDRRQKVSRTPSKRPGAGMTM